MNELPNQDSGKNSLMRIFRGSVANILVHNKNEKNTQNSKN